MQWYVYAGGQQYGPAADEVLEAWIGDGRIQATDLVWDPDASNWVGLGVHPRFQAVFARRENLATPPLAAGPSSVAMTPTAGTEIHFAERPDLEGHRRYIRMPAHLRVRWAESSTYGKPKNPEDAQAVNISFGGLAFETLHPPKIGSVLHLELHIEDGLPSFDCLAETRRHAAGFSPGHTEVGCRFRTTTEEGLRYLFQRLEAALAIRPPEA